MSRNYPNSTPFFAVGNISLRNEYLIYLYYKLSVTLKNIY